MLDIDDVEVGGVLYCEWDQDGKILKNAWKITDIDETHVFDKCVWSENGGEAVGEIGNYNYEEYEEYLADGDYEYHPPGEWRIPDKAFEEHRERLLNA